MRTLPLNRTFTGQLCMQPLPEKIQREFLYDTDGFYTGQDFGCLDATDTIPVGSHRVSILLPNDVVALSATQLRAGVLW